MAKMDGLKCIDEGPTIGVLEPEMFAGVETIVVPSEPDLTSYNSIELATAGGEERAKFQFSGNNNVTFHRRFPQVDLQEALIDYYSCALQADILLQGYLYITENYFAFYSNILGLYKTKILIPVCDVLDITKEKTAIIIPNAVGIETHEGKYVFASLLSRETTYRLMIEVWKNTISMDTFPFDHLRPAPEVTTDNGNSSPSTPTKEEPPIKPIKLPPQLLQGTSSDGPGRLSITKTTTTLTGSTHDVSLIKSKTSTLKPIKLVRRSKGKRHGFRKYSETSTPETQSDLDYGQDEDCGGSTSLGKELRKTKSPINKVNNTLESTKRGTLNGWMKRLSIQIKSFRERLKSDLNTPFLHISLIILLTYLLISTVYMIHRINLLNDLFESLTSNPKAQRILNNYFQVEQIRTDLSTNMVKIDDLKSSLVNLLDSVETVFNSDCADSKDDLFTKPSMLKICPLKDRL